MELNNNVGKLIKTIRTYNGIKQKDMASALNIKSPLLSLYEHGKREISIQFLYNFTNYLNMSLSDLFYLVEQIDNEELIYQNINKINTSNVFSINN